MVEQVGVEFVAKETGVADATRTLINNIHSVQDVMEAMRGFMDGFGQGIREVFGLPPKGLEEGADQAANAMRRLGNETDEAGSKAKKSKGDFDELGGMVRGYLAYLSVDRIYSWIDAQSHAAEKLQQTSERLRMSTQDIQGWQAVITAAGMSSDGWTSAMTRLENASNKAAEGSKEQSAAFKELGISAQTAKDPTELILQIADKFKGMEDGPQKVALAIALMGRAGAEQIPILNQGRDALQEQMQAARDLGAVMSDEMVVHALEVDSAMDTAGQAAQGLSNILFDALAPSIEGAANNFSDFVKGIVESYNEGGTAKSVFDGLNTTLSALWLGLTTIARAIWAAMQIVASALADAIGQIQTFAAWTGAKIDEMEAYWNAYSRVVQDALTLNWGSIRSDWEAGMNSLAATVAKGKADIAAAGAGSFGRSDELRAGSVYTMSQIADAANAFSYPAIELNKPPPKMGGGGGGSLGSGGGGGGGGGKTKKDEVQEWAEELKRQQALSGEFYKDQTASELAFWTEKLALTKSGSDSWYEVQEKIYALSKRQAQNDYQEKMASLTAQMQLERGYYDQQVTLMEQKLALARNTYGEDSKEYRALLREKESMERQHQDELTQLNLRGIAARAQIAIEAARTDFQLEQLSMANESAMIDARERAGILGRRQAAAERAALVQREFDERRELEDRLYQLTVQSLRDQLAVQNLRPDQMAAINASIEKEAAAHNQRMRVLAGQESNAIANSQRAASDAIRTLWMSRLQPVTAAFTTMVNGFLTGTTSIREAVLQAGSQILQSVTSWLMKWVQEHVAAEVAKTSATTAGETARTSVALGANATRTAASVTSGTTEITTNAAVAGSGALAAVSKIPFIGPFIAPAIAAGIMALAMGFISKMASAEGGWDQVPEDGMVTELHKDEMVLPSSIASPLRAALGMVGSSSDAGGGGGLLGGGGGGSTHIHIHAMDTKSGAQWLMDNAEHVARAGMRAARNGVGNR